MIFAMTYEQALKFVPPEITDVPVSPPTKKMATVESGERVRTSRHWLYQSRRDLVFNKPDRSWKRHRRLQCGSLRIK